jgi:hypothetical protein
MRASELRPYVLQAIGAEGIIKGLKAKIADGIGEKPLILRVDGLCEEMQDQVISEMADWILLLGKTGKPTILMIDEAHRYIQQVGASKSKKAINNLAAEGRKFGCGLILMSQRPAKVDKNALSQCGLTIIFKLTNQNDIKQMRDSTEYSTKEMFAEVQRLGVGDGLIVSSKFKRPIFIHADEFKGEV